MIRESEILLPNVQVKLLIVGASKRKLATQEGEQENTKCPDIGRRARILNFTDDLWRHVGRSTTENLDLPLMGDAGGEAEVDHLDSLLGLIKQDVL